MVAETHYLKEARLILADVRLTVEHSYQRRILCEELRKSLRIVIVVRVVKDLT
jgi:hypothetical protein